MSHLTFRAAATITSAICMVLACTWAIVPDFLPHLWNVEFTYPVGLVARRGAALFAGVAIILFGARDAEPSPARSAIGRGCAFGCLALALLGTAELATGHAGPGILFAVVVEIAIAFAFFTLNSREKEHSRA